MGAHLCLVLAIWNARERRTEILSTLWILLTWNQGLKTNKSTLYFIHISHKVVQYLITKQNGCTCTYIPFWLFERRVVIYFYEKTYLICSVTSGFENLNSKTSSYCFPCIVVCDKVLKKWHYTINVQNKYETQENVRLIQVILTPR